MSSENCEVKHLNKEDLNNLLKYRSKIKKLEKLPDSDLYWYKVQTILESK